MRYHAPYMEWAKTRPSPLYDLAGSNVLACSIEELQGARQTIALDGKNDAGYGPLVKAIATRYGVSPSHVTTAQGASGANFLVYAALLEAGDDVLVESPGYDPLLGAPRLVGANVVRFQRTLEDRWRLHPGDVETALTPKTKLIVITTPHNPTGAVADVRALRDIGRLAERHGAHVLVDEVYLDASDTPPPPAATYGDPFISTSSLTKSYGLAGLRSGWILSNPSLAHRFARARDVVDGTGSIVAERLAALAFQQLESLAGRARLLMDANAATVREFLRARTDLECVEATAATVIFPRIRGVMNSDRFCERLMTEHETAIVPGRFFDAPAHFRIGFGGPTELLKGGLAQIAGALDARAWS